MKEREEERRKQQEGRSREIQFGICFLVLSGLPLYWVYLPGISHTSLV